MSLASVALNIVLNDRIRSYGKHYKALNTGERKQKLAIMVGRILVLFDSGVRILLCGTRFRSFEGESHILNCIQN